MRESLVGRDAEVVHLDAFLTRAAADGEALMLVGEPGVGKTALLDAAADLAARHGTRVVRASGVEFEQELSFSGLHQVLYPLLDHLDRLDEGHRGALCVALGLTDGATPDRMVISTAALTLVRTAALARPLLLVVDDVPWLDSASSTVLGSVGRRLAGSHAALLAAARPGEAGRFGSAIGATYEVRPLDEHAAGELLQSIAPGLGSRARRRILSEARGYPLALLELPSVPESRRPELDDGLGTALPLSRRLQDLFESRVAELPEPTRRLLLLAALDGTGELSVVQAATGEAGLANLEPAERGLIVHGDLAGGRLRFRHPLIRAAIVGRATLQERREAHRVLAGIVTNDPERRAQHLADAAAGPDAETAALLQEAGRRMARRGDGYGAVATLVRSAALSPEPGERAARLAEAAFTGVNLNWDLAQAAGLLADARRVAPEMLSSLPAAAATAFLYLNGDGDTDAAHRLLVDALERRPGALDAADEDVVAVISQIFLACLFAGRVEPWAEYRAALARLQPAVPTDLRLLNAAADPARVDPADLALLNATIDSIDDEPNPWVMARVAGVAYHFDLLAGCRKALWQTVRGPSEGGGVSRAISSLTVLWRDALITGDWDGVVRISEHGLRLCAEVGSEVFVHSFRVAMALVAAGRGDLATVEETAGRVTSWALTHRALALHFVAVHSRALAAIGLGDWAGAYDHLTAISPAGTFAPYRPVAVFACMDLVEAAVHTGRPQEAAAHVVAIQQLGIATMSPHFALLAAGAAALAERDQTQAVELFEAALEVPGAGDWPFDEARIRLAYGERLRRARANSRARPELAAALATFERLGARPWVERARNELRAAGEARASGDRAPGAEEVLTPQERDIATLAATGLSNKQIGERLFLSHRTVSTHLYRIFPKLGVTKRAGLRAALERLDAQSGSRENPPGD